MKKILTILLVIALSLSVFASCGNNESASDFREPNSQNQSQKGESEESAAQKPDISDDIPSDLQGGANTLTVTCTEGTDNCWVFDGQTLTFSQISADTVCSLSGEFNGQIVVDAGDDYKFELELCGVTLYSGDINPVTVLSGDKVTVTAKKGSENYIYDTRDAVDENDETAYSSAVYSKCDLDLGGKGSLTVVSANNNGIHTKKDLKVKNLTLSVTCEDNALRGNDGATIAGGIITLVAKSGDGIKTTDTDVSSKGNQRGIVSISAGTVNIYAALDGIDAAYNVEISGDAVVNVYTDIYSPYSDIAETSSDSSHSSAASVGGAGFGGFGGGGRPGGQGGFGGMTDGNADKNDYSSKGIKADNEIVVYGGSVTVKSYDDSIHANGSVALENGETSIGNVTISGGTLSLFSKDDGVHADGTLSVTGGVIDITGSYEGLEGAYVVIGGGEISIVSSDDGINATATSGTGISFEGGKVYVYAGGDGVDSNSRASYGGIIFAGGEIIIVSTSGGDSSIDTEQGYAYTGGTVLAVCPSGGMANEAVNCRNFSSVGSKTTMNLTQGQTLSVTVGEELVASVVMPCRLSAFIVYLGSSSAKFSVD